METEQDYDFYVEIMNIYLASYNKNNDKNSHFFENVKLDQSQSINEKMALFFDQMKKYKKDNPKLIKYKPNKLIPKNSYILTVDDIKKKYSINIFPILLELSEMDWTNTNWNIQIS
ncbi:MAG: hypothetical protein CMF62_02995 [Magnetococcales bacterium]|nr:hypothetical protein [Magnetococcales bacterium]|tara:strand:+ start:13495 stop:13842 length:348 start_codon:yes stop_codon:yes gene_type:complete